MPETQSNLHSKPRLRASSLHPQASAFPQTGEKVMYKSFTLATPVLEKTATRTPAEIGTRGTFASLMMKEIECFSQLELGCRDKLEKSRRQFRSMASTSDHSRPKLGSWVTTPKRKKKGGSKFIPSMCSLVEVAENTRPDIISGFNYRNLKADVKQLQA
ncbi:hypothetical protein RHSIM_Rhsim04G0002000 [Rhododendron simsii]|uniref:Uncharacterized protein n=1 Tax=Rhododendron simsii TaxID=118357 RepID=A0A834H0G3_RHOSS|nr:hypothetical protein RHSIM_Rhsim04G0002000 [Rhododendron simsii]